MKKLAALLIATTLISPVFAEESKKPEVKKTETVKAKAEKVIEKVKEKVETRKPEAAVAVRGWTARYFLDSGLSVFTRRHRRQGGLDGPVREAGGCGVRWATGGCRDHGILEGLVEIFDVGEAVDPEKLFLERAPEALDAAVAFGGPNP
jgi:hypothetical protein